MILVDRHPAAGSGQRGTVQAVLPEVFALAGDLKWRSFHVVIGAQYIHL
jgi:hypothetical protein